MKNKFTLETITEDFFDRVLNIYNTNQEYFKMSMNEKPSIEAVLQDKNEMPPGSSLEDKNYKLIILDGIDIGIIDYVENYPDEDAVYIGLFMIKGDFHRSGYGREFINEFIRSIQGKGYSRIRLGVLNQNEKALNFWTRMDFKLVKEIISTIHPERNWKIKVMEKSLDKKSII